MIIIPKIIISVADTKDERTNISIFWVFIGKNDESSHLETKLIIRNENFPELHYGFHIKVGKETQALIYSLNILQTFPPSKYMAKEDEMDIPAS